MLLHADRSPTANAIVISVAAPDHALAGRACLSSMVHGSVPRDPDGEVRLALARVAGHAGSAPADHTGAVRRRG